MKTALWMSGILAWTFLAAPVATASSPTKTTPAPERFLAPGTYTAKVAALPCEACAPKVRETLMGIPGVRAVVVDLKTSTAQFTLKKNARIKLSELQKALLASSADMGMGADYSLSQLQRVTTP